MSIFSTFYSPSEKKKIVCKKCFFVVKDTSSEKFFFLNLRSELINKTPLKDLPLGKARVKTTETNSNEKTETKKLFLKSRKSFFEEPWTGAISFHSILLLKKWLVLIRLRSFDPFRKTLVKKVSKRELGRTLVRSKSKTQTGSLKQEKLILGNSSKIP